MSDNIIRIGHGSGGRLSRNLISEIFVKHFSNPTLNGLGDASWVKAENEHIAFTTDSYVIDPIFFPGGDIGQLAISGTVNDLAVSGAIPKFLSVGFILEEGFLISDLEQIAQSMAKEAKAAKIEIIAGDTKVVKRGQCDRIFINTSGIGFVPENHTHLKNGTTINPGDKVIVTGTLGDHAIAILSAREELDLDEKILSDATPLNGLTGVALSQANQICMMRDITRGGLATVLVEICENKDFGILIRENDIPVRQSVQSVCDLFGFDPLYLANEGKIMIIVKKDFEQEVLDRLRNVEQGKEAVIIGEITNTNPGKAVMLSSIGGKRIIDMLSGEMLPRIC